MTLTRSQLPVYQFSAKGFKAFQGEQAKLLKDRPVAVEELARAREMGDLSENGFYKAARAKLSSIDSRLRRLAILLKYGKIVKSSNSDIVQFGSLTTITDGKIERTFELVGALEADPLKGRLSVVSPIGKALLGKKKGETVKIEIPSGIVEYTIVSIK